MGGSRVVVALTGALLAAGCSTGADERVGRDGRDRLPEAWPPTNATECLRTRPPTGNAVIWSAALAVRDWQQPVRDGRVEVMFCGQASPGSRGEPLVVTVSAEGGVGPVADADLRWDRSGDDLVTPITAEVTGPGTLSVTVSDEGGTAQQGMAVFVLESPEGLVLSECHDPDRCSWD